MVEKIDLSNLSSDVIRNIASFMIGKPEVLRLKHNEALKRIQKKCKPHFTEIKEHEYEDIMKGIIVGRPEIKELHNRKKVIRYDFVQSKFSHNVPPFIYINHEQQEKMKNIILKEIQQLKENGNYQYIKKILITILRFYDDENNVPEHLQSIYERGKCIKINNIENLDMELEEIVRDKLRDEIDFHVEHRDIRIYSYRFMVEFEIEKIIYKEQKQCSDCKVVRNIDQFENENLNCNICLRRGAKYRHNNPEKQKQRYQRYYEEHKERLLEEKKEYRKDYNQREEECEICKCKYKKPHSSKHRKTKMHLANLKKLANEITN